MVIDREARKPRITSQSQMLAEHRPTTGENKLAKPSYLESDDYVIILKGAPVKIKTFAQPTEAYTAEMISEWLGENFPGFGRFQGSKLVEGLSKSKRDLLTAEIKRHAGICTRELIEGALIAGETYQKIDSSMPPASLVFIDGEYKERGVFTFSGVAGDLRLVFIDTKVLETYVAQLAFIHGGTVRALYGRFGSKIPLGISTVAKHAKLGGIEEVDHLEFVRKYGIEPSSILDETKVTRKQYDGQPHELRGLMHQRKYVVAHLEEFPDPESGGPTELDILDERIREAREECTNNYGEAIVRQIEEDIEKIKY